MRGYSPRNPSAKLDCLDVEKSQLFVVYFPPVLAVFNFHRRSLYQMTTVELWHPGSLPYTLAQVGACD
jgi:hypothetical protein